MKRVKKYLRRIYQATMDWDNGWERATQFIADGENALLIGLMKHHTKMLMELDCQDVADAILEHQEEIEFRLKRIDNYRIWPTMQHIFDNAGTIADFSDGEVNEAMNICHDWIIHKSKDFVNVYRECEEFIKPQNPILAKGLVDPLLLSYFFDNRKELEKYLNYCLEDTDFSMKAYRAKELADKGKIRKGCLRKPLHDALQKIGIDTGSYVNWQQAIKRF